MSGMLLFMGRPLGAWTPEPGLSLLDFCSPHPTQASCLPGNAPCLRPPQDWWQIRCFGGSAKARWDPG